MTSSGPFPIQPSSILDKRSCQDRRRKISFPPSFCAHRRRRRSGRRRNDRAQYVDIYDLGTWGVALAVLLLSLLDAILTELQIRSGLFREANPLMNAVIAHAGLITFISVKMALTAMPLAIIVLHKEWAVARYAARICLLAYILLALYHLYLIFSFHR